MQYSRLPSKRVYVFFFVFIATSTWWAGNRFEAKYLRAVIEGCADSTSRMIKKTSINVSYPVTNKTSPFLGFSSNPLTDQNGSTSSHGNHLPKQESQSLVSVVENHRSQSTESSTLPTHQFQNATGSSIKQNASNASGAAKQDSQNRKNVTRISNLTTLKTGEQPAKKGVGHRKVTDRWLRQCVQELSKKPLKPFFTLRHGYALGDCVRFCNKCNWRSKRSKLEYAFGNGTIKGNVKNHNYPNWTMAGSYARLACPAEHPDFQQRGNLTIVSRVLRKFRSRSGFVKPDPDAVVVHLRLGDVIEFSNAPVLRMLTKGATPFHHARTSIRSAYEYLKDLANASKVEIIGGSHVPFRYEKSRVYAGCLEKALKLTGKDVRMELDGGNADKDFYYMCHAQKLIVSAGGYSELIGKMVKRNGGELIGRTF